MATVPEIPVVQVSVQDGDLQLDALSSAQAVPAQAVPVQAVPVQAWAPVEVPRGRPSPIVLAVLGVLAGLGAMALGAVAVVSAGASSSDDQSASVSQVSSGQAGVEGRVLALLAKPSTERIVFQGSGGRLVLAVGSGGRAAILVRGLQRAPTGKAYSAWVVVPGSAPVRVARLHGSEHAVFLSAPVGPKASVVVSTVRPVARPLARTGLIASRG